MQTHAQEHWRLIVDRGGGGFRNMAVDAALMQSAGERLSQAWTHTLRLYWFTPPALSIGAFQPLADVNLPACAAAGIDVVRRPTGGRAVLHDGCLTYSVTGPAGGPVFGGGIRPSYQRIAAALLEAIARLGGAPAETAVPRRVTVSSASCFDHAAPYEPVFHGAKVAGSAQARRGNTALQHGSLRLFAGEVPLACLLRHGPRAEGTDAVVLPPTLTDLLGTSVTREDAVTAFRLGFCTAFAVELVEAGLTAAEASRAAGLEAERFRSPEWTERL